MHERGRFVFAEEAPRVAWCAFMRWILRLLLLSALVTGVMWFHHVRTHRPSRVDEATKAGILLVGNGSEPESRKGLQC